MPLASKIGISICAAILLLTIGLGLLWKLSTHWFQKPATAELQSILLTSINKPHARFPADPAPHWTLINFWAPWCAPCRKELPLFNQLARKYEQTPDRHLEVVGIALDSTRAVRRFLSQNSIRYPIFVVPHGERSFVSRFHITLVGLPITILLDRHDQIIATHVGILNANSLATILPKSWLTVRRPH